MDQPTATLIAGITAAVGSVAVGISALVFAAKNTKRTLDQQRDEAKRDRRAAAKEAKRKRQHDRHTAEQQRLWERRAEAHRALLEWLGDAEPISDVYLNRSTLDARELKVSPNGTVRRRPTRCKPVPGAIQAAVRLSATNAVVDLLANLNKAAEEEKTFIIREHLHIEKLKLVTGGKDPLDYVDDIVRARTTWTTDREKLLIALREDYPSAKEQCEGESDGPP